MLRIAKRLRELSFPQLMEIYVEGNRENGAERYPEEPEMRQLALAEADFRQYLAEVFFRQKGAFYAIWEENGQYVSALRLEPYRDGLLLEALETRPDRRRKGYASGLIRAVLNFPEVKKVYSHVSKRNVPSLAVHKKLGFQVVEDLATYIDGSVNYRAVTLCWEEALLNIGS